MRVLLIPFFLALMSCADRTDGVRESTASAPETESERLNAWLDAQFEEELGFSPQRRTMLGDKTDYDRLGDVSEAGMDVELEWRRRSVAAMRGAFDYELLDDEAKTSYDLWAYSLERAERGVPYRRYGYIFERGGPHASLPNFLINLHRVDTVEDMRAYVSRVREIGRVLREYLVRARAASADGIRQPRFGYRFAIDEIDRVLAGEPFSADGQSPLWADARAKIEGLIEADLLTEVDGRAFDAELREALVEAMAPAYQEVRSWLEEDMRLASPDPQGVWALPDGQAYYEHRLFVMTTLELTANEIHQTGLREVERILGDMETLKEAVGFAGTLQEFFAFVRADPQFYFPDTDEGRQGYIDLATEYLDQMGEALPQYFGLLPRAGLVVRRVEPFREQPGAAQHYRRAAPDGSRPGIFYAHLSDMSLMPRYSLESIAYHEGHPGHHTQLSIAQELEEIPRFRTQYSYGAYIEGWALYAEALAKEMGFYGDPYSDFGRLSSEMLRAMRLVIDTGLHANGWTEEEAVRYAVENSPMPEGTIRSEVERYLSMPAQATVYKVGMLKIQELRDRARERLGDRFDIRQFHDVVLGGGALPLIVLEARVDRWIEQSIGVQSSSASGSATAYPAQAPQIP